MTDKAICIWFQAVLSRKHKHNEKGLVYHGLRSLLGQGLITSKGKKGIS